MPKPAIGHVAFRPIAAKGVRRDTGILFKVISGYDDFKSLIGDGHTGLDVVVVKPFFQALDKF